VEEFGRTVPDRPASRATWLAVQGWLKHLAARDVEAREFFEASKAADEDVPYGTLFHGMIYFGRYLREQLLPSASLGSAGSGSVEFGAMPPEIPHARKIRETFEAQLRSLSAKAVWGDASAAEIGRVLEGFRGMHEMNLEQAERGLSDALLVPELAWIEADVRMARSTIRYLRQDFEASRADVDKVLRLAPDHPEAHLRQGELWLAVALGIAKKGENARPALEKAIVAFDELLRRAPREPAPHCGRGMAHKLMGEAEALDGRDPRPFFRKAVEDFSELIRYAPDRSTGYLNRASTNRVLGSAEAALGGSAGPYHEKALEDYEQAIRIGPEDGYGYEARAFTHLELARHVFRGEHADRALEESIRDFGKALEKGTDKVSVYAGRAMAYLEKGVRRIRYRQDPEEVFLLAVKDASEGIRLDSGSAVCWTRRSRAHVLVGQHRARRSRKDPMRSFRQAEADANRALDLDARSHEALSNRALARFEMGKRDDAAGVDPRPRLRKAVEDYAATLKIKPTDAHTASEAAAANFEIGFAEERWGGDSAPHFDEGVRRLRRLAAQTPSNWQTHINLSYFFEKAGRYIESVKALEDAGRAAPRAKPMMAGLLARVRSLASLPVWRQGLLHGEKALERGAYREAERALGAALVGASEAEPAETAEHGSALGKARYRLAVLHARASAGKRDSMGPPKPVSEEEAASLRAKALSRLDEAIASGWGGTGALRDDPDLEALKKDPAFEALLGKWEAKGR
jgi:tetratricopeptide (TPR) repeat protein